MTSDKALQAPPLDVNAVAQQSSDVAPLTGVYSSSGFDMVGILSRLVNRPNPQINLGPIDMSCSFLVTDARQTDCPIVYCSPTFINLTGYNENEILRRNCRFLQAPDGHVDALSIRQYTDNNAVLHLKTQMMQNREHQASIINYRKGGQPFVNLVTVIPLYDDDGKVAFFVGLQVDLVEQPNAILQKMKDGTYYVNYQQMNIPAYSPIRQTVTEPVDEYFRELPSEPVLAATTTTVSSLSNNPEILELVRCSGSNEQQLQQEWNKLLLDQADDFIHVLSLKGFFLYCSRAASSLLEHDPEELVGRPLSSICHPSDIVPVMREIKEAASRLDTTFSLLYRLRRKYSGYMWMECQGKVHVDQSKSRKCLILAGRERPVLSLAQKDIVPPGPLQEEFWAKMSLDGLFLHVTSTSPEVVGFEAKELEGESLFQYVGDREKTQLESALSEVKNGQIKTIQHTMLNNKGQYIATRTTIYPGDLSNGIGRPTVALIQVRCETAAAEWTDQGDNEELGNGENMFNEIDNVRGTSWQYEIHQLEIANRKIREQIEKYTERHPAKTTKKRARATASPNEPKKMCAQCQSQDSPEWRKGPNGPKELCNACGLRYAKTLATNKAP